MEGREACVFIEYRCVFDRAQVNFLLGKLEIDHLLLTHVFCCAMKDEYSNDDPFKW